MDRQRSTTAIIFIIVLALLAGCSRSAPVPTSMPDATAVPTNTPAPATETSTAVATEAATAAPEPTAEPTKVQARALLVSEADTVDASAPVRVSVVVENAVGLFGVQFHISFDPALVQIEDADESLPDVQLAAGEAFSRGKSFVALNRADNQSGKIDFAATLLTPAEPLQGRVVLATFEMSAAGAGKADIDYTKVLLADRDGNSLPVAWEGTHIEARLEQGG